MVALTTISTIAQTPVSEFMLEDNLLFWRYKANAEVGAVEAEEEIRIGSELIENNKVVIKGILIDIQQVRSVSWEARIKFKEAGEAFGMRIALLNKSPISVIIGNLFIGWNKPDHPVRLFATEKNARDWLIS